MHITFIQAGGTIDKDYPRGETNHGYEFAITDPAVNAMLPHCHVMFSYDVVSVAKKDSLDLTDADREAIYTAVQASPSQHIVITHGTDTIVKTAEVLSSISHKVIVLTGAMLPDKFINSDARFNVGMAIASVQNLAPGIYIALYGRVVPWNEYPTLYAEYEARAKGTVMRENNLDPVH